MLAQKQPPFKECVTAYWSMCSCADNVRGLKSNTEAEECLRTLVEERCVRGEAADGNLRGAHTSENVGISSE